VARGLVTAERVLPRAQPRV